MTTGAALAHPPEVRSALDLLGAWHAGRGGSVPRFLGDLGICPAEKLAAIALGETNDGYGNPGELA